MEENKLKIRDLRFATEVYLKDLGWRVSDHVSQEDNHSIVTYFNMEGVTMIVNLLPVNEDITTAIIQKEHEMSGRKDFTICNCKNNESKKLIYYIYKFACKSYISDIFHI